MIPILGGSDVDIATVISTMLLVWGLTTILHTFLGSRLPLIQGSSFVYLAPALVIVNSQEFMWFHIPYLCICSLWRQDILSGLCLYYVVSYLVANDIPYQLCWIEFITLVRIWHYIITKKKSHHFDNWTKI
ncbi:hypothetical protein ACQ4PT_067835 [Festuca glaucescens]